MGKARGMVGVTLAGPEVARATSKYNLFWALEKPKKAFKITVMIAYLLVFTTSLLDGWMHAGW